MSEMLATLPGASYIARTSVHDPKHVRETKKAIKEAFQVQVEGKGFSLVEVLSACPTNWHMTPVESLEWIKNEMIAYYPLGKFKSAEEAK
jgi:2-oxoglutarate ferredoxin oxidoreductase subunit beta